MLTAHTSFARLNKAEVEEESNLNATQDVCSVISARSEVISTRGASWDAGGIVGFAFRRAPTLTILCGNTILLRTSSAIQDIYAAEIWTGISEEPRFLLSLIVLRSNLRSPRV